jgi:hypothetical protein
MLCVQTAQFGTTPALVALDDVLSPQDEAEPTPRMRGNRTAADATRSSGELIGVMTHTPFVISPTPQLPGAGQISLRARVVLIVLAFFVLLGAVGVVEVGALAVASVVSSGTNHGGGGN